MNKSQLIVGITGTNGAGKGTVVEILQQKDFEHLSVGGYLMEEAIKAGWAENRESQIRMGNKLREKYGTGYIMEQLYEKALKMGNKVVIESIRNEGEVTTLRAKGKFFLLAVNADRELRYERIVKRGGLRDKVSYEEFSKSEDGEMTSTEVNKQNLFRCMELADYTIENVGTMGELRQKVEEMLKIIEK